MSTTELTPELVAAFEHRAARGARRGAESIVVAAASASVATSLAGDGGVELDHRPPRHLRRAVLVAAAALVALIVGSAAILVLRDPPVDTVTTPGPATTEGSWHELGRLPGPLTTSGYPLEALVVGNELVLPGLLGSGDRDVARVGESPVLDLRAGTWRTLPAPPSDVYVSVYRPTPVATDREAVVFGVRPRPAGAPDGGEGPPVALALDVASGTWRDTGSAPGSTSGAAWTGREVLTWARDLGLQGWSPSAPSWTSWGSPPGGSSGAGQMVWTGSSAVVVTSEGRTAVVDGVNSWREGDQAPISHEGTEVVWTGSSVAALDSDGLLSTFDLETGAWTERASAPFQARSIRDVTVGAAGRVVVLGGLQFDYSPGSSPPAQIDENLVWDPVSDSWSDLPPLPDGIDGVATAVGDGNRVLAVAAADDGSLVVLALDLGPSSSGPASTTVVPTAPTATTAATGADIKVPSAPEAPNARLVVGHVPEGFRSSPGPTVVMGAGTSVQHFDDPSSGLSTVPVSGPRWLTVSLVRTQIDSELLAAWHDRDEGRLRAAAQAAWRQAAYQPVQIRSYGGRPVITMSSTVEAPTPGLEARRDVQVIIVAGPDSFAQISATNLTDDEIDAVVHGLRVEVG